MPKPIIGASNPTVVLNAIAKSCGIATYHGPSTIWDFGDIDQPASTLDAFVRFFMHGDRHLGTVPEFLTAGDAMGKCFGGNLSSLLLLAGTEYFPEYSGGVMIWEDIGESSDRLYAKLTQLDEMGVLSSLGGMIVGELVDCADSNDFSCRDAVMEVCGKYGYPIGWGLPFGHTPEKVIVPIGTEVGFSSTDGILSFTGTA